MKSVPRGTLLLLVMSFLFGMLHAQVGRVSIHPTITASEYDVLFLTDFFSARDRKFNPAAAGFSVDITVTRPQRGEIQISLGLRVEARLHGETRFTTIVDGTTKPFPMNGSGQLLRALDFAGSGIAPIPGYQTDQTFKNKISDRALATGTAPAGTYRITVKVIPASSQTYTGNSDTKIIEIPYSSVDEVLVDITDPKDGSYSANLAPTFNWTTGASQVVVRVFEAGANHRSPQDALTGSNPCLVKEVAGATSLTYPSDASRQLQENRAYVLQVEAMVSTNRGASGNSSRPVVFRITDDKVGQMLDNFTKSLGDNAASSYTSLRSEPSNWVQWSAYGKMTLDGKALTETDVQALLNELAGRSDVKPDLEVQNQ